MAEPHRSLPHFLIAGAQKGGTTWLSRNMARHPDIFMPRPEIRYFNIDSHYRQGVEWYRQHFTEARDDQLIGEKTPDYMQVYRGSTMRPVAERIQHTLPDVKLLFVLRNPVKRALSALRHHMYNRRFPPTAALEDILFGRYKDVAEKWNILSGGYYGSNLGHFVNVFGEQRIRVWIFEEDVVKAPRETLRTAFQFLDLAEAPAEHPISDAANVGIRTRPAMIANYYLPFLGPVWHGVDRVLPGSSTIKAPGRCLDRLYEHYGAENERLFALIGRRIPSWDQPSSGSGGPLAA